MKQLINEKLREMSSHKEQDQRALEELAYNVIVDPTNKDAHRLYNRICEVYKMRYGEEFCLEIDERRNCD